MSEDTSYVIDMKHRTADLLFDEARDRAELAALQLKAFKSAQAPDMSLVRDERDAKDHYFRRLHIISDELGCPIGRDILEWMCSVIKNLRKESKPAEDHSIEAKALRAFADSETLKDDFGHGEVITKHDVRTALRAEADQVEKGEA